MRLKVFKNVSHHGCPTKRILGCGKAKALYFGLFSMIFDLFKPIFLAAGLFYIPKNLDWSWAGWYRVNNAGLDLLFSHCEHGG